MKESTQALISAAAFYSAALIFALIGQLILAAICFVLGMAMFYYSLGRVG